MIVVCFHPPAIRAAIDTFGIDHVLLGSDCPPVSLPWARTIGAVRALGLPADDEAKVVGGNACRLFRL